jgi:hypothetical protein
MSRAAGGDKIELLPAVISQRLKRKMPELSADPVGLFGRSWTLFKFCLRVSSQSAERFKSITLYSREARQAKVFCVSDRAMACC